MEQRESCLVSRLSCHITLSPSERSLIRELEEIPQNFRKGVDIHMGGEPSSDLYIVREGWLFEYSNFSDGRRQIVKIYLPGDIIGFPDIAMKYVTTSLQAVDDVCLCRLTKHALGNISAKSPQLFALLLSMALRAQAGSIDLLLAMGRMSAIERIGYFFLDLASRLRIIEPAMTNSFSLPMNQSQIADYLGLTNVSVCKTVQRLQLDGIIKRNGKKIIILNEQRLKELVDLNDRHTEIDTSWFPGGLGVEHHGQDAASCLRR